MRTICETIGGNASFCDSGCAIGMPSWTRSRTSRRASSITQLPEVVPVISSALTMSTPAPTSVARVREKRAMLTLRTVSPIFIGTRSLKRSQTRRPGSVPLA